MPKQKRKKTNMNNLHGKTALITGGSKGIGYGIRKHA